MYHLVQFLPGVERLLGHPLEKKEPAWSRFTPQYNRNHFLHFNRFDYDERPTHSGNGLRTPPVHLEPGRHRSYHFRFFTVLLAGFDLAGLHRPPANSKFRWLYRHIGRMGGAYIAIITAFLVINLTFLPDMVAWLGPTFIGSPLITFYIRRYKKRLESPDAIRGHPSIKKAKSNNR